MVWKVLSFAVAVIYAVSAAPQSRITGGDQVDITDVPYMAALVYHYPRINLRIQRCVGPLISSYHVLTTAFCFNGAVLENFTIRAGSTLSLSGGVTSTIQHLIKNPGFVSETLLNDIAIVFVKEPFRISNVIRSLRLPPQGFEIPDGRSGIVSGWGFDKERVDGGTQHEYLQSVLLRKVTQRVCTETYANNSNVTVTDSVYCATETNKGVCFGDSGAPMVAPVYSTAALIGISSYYQGCGSTYPDIFTRVDRYSNWIMENAVAPSARSLEFDTPRIAN
ncbi:unnamed protein product [Leptosia nina]|uniref:Peptidase S1 domain-containing protein n=1 Tax=Leptosia nina TaxID=320188 RepID=A0AAV1JF42_9NEOP